jgi:fibronectin-binding autotransporter adhesin
MMSGRSYYWRGVLGVFALLATNTFLLTPNVCADSFDWRTVDGYNWNTSIKSQFGGTCWDFSSCATLEAKYKLTRNDPSYDPDLSEQQICWETSPDMGSTGGGWGTAVLEYSTTHGVVSETECPYQPDNPDTGVSPYWPLASGWANRVWKSTSISTGFTDDTSTMKAYLKSCGPLLVGLWASHDLYTSVDDMIANYRSPDSSGYDHQVSLVGYCDDSRVATGGYWIIKNSWGYSNTTLGDYGNNGYYLIPYGNLEVHNDISAITGAVYYTGAMATATWTGGAGAWALGNATKWNSGAYAWENKETAATFSGAGGAVTISGPAIAHGITISSGATGYTFSGGTLTVTAGGITANESTTISSPLFVGAPQTWTIASGKTMTIGDLHTIISQLTVSGSGNMTVNGTIDGGGVINITGGAAPGNIVKSGSGALNLNGPANYSGNISATAGTLNFIPPTGVVGAYSGVISGSAPISKSGVGTVIFSGADTYTGATTVSAGALQANSGAGLPAASLLKLDGGVLQSNSTVTFTRSLGTSGSNKFQFTANGGGFAAGAGPMTVKINNSTSSITWGTTVGTNIVGALKFGSESAANVVTLQNGINLNAATRTINVDDNAATGADYAVISGVITYGSGTAGITKTGNGVLVLTGTNTFNGTTTISGGAIQAAIGTGIPSSRFLKLDGGVYQSNGTYTFTRSLGTSGSTFQWTANGGGFSAGAGALTVNIGSGTALTWGTTVGTNIVGTLKFGSATAANVTTFQNAVNLNAATRTIQVDDNISSTADYAVMSGVISNSTGTAGITKTGSGLLLLTGADTYNGTTTISGGELQAAIGTGIPTASFLKLDGGIYQSNSAYTFTRSLGTSGSTFQWTANGGGFAAGAGALTVNIGSGTALTWGTTVGSQLVGTLKLNSSMASYATTFQNSINLYGGARTIYVDDNTASSADYAVLSGVLSDSVGGATLTKTGAGTLYIQGSSGNTYSGLTTIAGGSVYLNKTSGYAISGNLTLAGPNTFVVVQGSTAQINPSSVISWDPATPNPHFEVYGHNVTVGGISSTSGGVLENTEGEGGIANGTITVGNSSDCAYNGYMRDSSGGSGSLALIKSGTATLTLAGSNITYTGGTTINAGKLVLQNVTDSNFLAASITNNATLELNNSSDVTFNTPVTGTGVLSKADSFTLTLGSNVNCSGGLNFSTGKVVLTDLNTAILGGSIVNGGTLVVNANTTDMTISGAISNNANVGELVKNGAGKLTLTGSNTYGDNVGWTGFTTVNGGVLQADRGVGLPTGSCLVLNGGVLQSNSATTFDTGFWYNWGFLAWVNGGFSAGGGKMTVNVGGGQQLTWGADGYSNLAGTMILSSTSAQYEVEVQNAIDLNGGARVVQVNDNTNSTGDYASISGVISDSVGGASLTKTGAGLLVIRGSSGNTYTGSTIVAEGNVDLAKTSGYAVPGDLHLSANSGSTFTRMLANNQIATTAVVYFDGGYWPHLELLGHALTLAGISDPNGTGVIENTQWETGVTTTGVLTINNTANFSFSGYIRDGNFGGSTGALALVKNGSGTLALVGSNTGGYTGGLTINAGTLDYSLGVLPNCTITINGGTLIYPGSGSKAASLAGDLRTAASSSLDAVERLLAASYNAAGGPFTAGQFVCNTADAAHGLGWAVDPVTSLFTIKFTVYGDANLDGSATLADLATLLDDFNQPGTWSQGDFNYDGIVNDADLAALLANYDKTSGLTVHCDTTLDTTAISMLSSAGISLVPEPGTLVMLAAGLVGLLAFAWRKRK